jgi:flagellar hook-length control protein FliK
VPPLLETAQTEATLEAAAVSVPGTPPAEKPTAGFKTQVAAQAKSSATAAVATTFGSTDAPAQATTATPQAPANVAPQPQLPPQPVSNGKPDNDNASAPSAKPDVTVNAAVPAPSVPASHDHATVTAGAQVTIAPDPGAQAAALAAPLQSTAPTPITTASFTAAPATGAPVPVSGLAVEIAASVQSGKTRFELRLDPADLGRIDVRIDVDRSGQVTSHLTVEKPETLSMLRQDAPQLQQALSDAGLKTSSNGLQFSLRDQSASGQQNWQDNNQSSNAQRLVVSEDTNVSASLAGQSYGRTPSASGGVDITV